MPQFKTIEVSFPEKISKRQVLITLLKLIMKVSLFSGMKRTQFSGVLYSIIVEQLVLGYKRVGSSFVRCGIYCPLTKSALLVVEQTEVKNVQMHLLQHLKIDDYEEQLAAGDALIQSHNLNPDNLHGHQPDWWQDAVGYDLAKKLDRNGAGVRVAVLDTGLNYDYEYYLSNIDEAGLACIKRVDLNQCDADVFQETDMHGTEVTALLASSQLVGGRTIGIAGGCTVIPIRVAQSSSQLAPGSLAAGICAAINCGADIIVSTFLSSRDTSFLRRACSLLEQKDIILVLPAPYRSHGEIVRNADEIKMSEKHNEAVASGNLNGEVKRGQLFPIDTPTSNMLIVGASVDENGTLSPFVDPTHVNIVAPGVSIRVPTVDNNGEIDSRLVEGTSYATPIVGALLAIAHQHYKETEQSTTVRGSVDLFKQSLSRNSDNKLIASLRGLESVQRS